MKKITLLLSIAFLFFFGYLFLKEPVELYLFRKSVLDKHNPLVTFPVFYSCYTENGLDFNESCNSALKKFVSRSWIDKWEQLIKTKKNINCSDFDDQDEAQSFYEFYGGGYFNAVIRAFPDFDDEYIFAKSEIRDNYMVLKKEYWKTSKTISEEVLLQRYVFKKNICKEYYYDPYNLDLDMDCNACETLDGVLFSANGLFE